MHSSISSSESPPQWPETYWRRPIPTAHWRAVGLMTLLIVGVFLAGWEGWWRSQGYEPGFENTADLWAEQRAKVGKHGRDETVIIGSSRILFDLDLDMWQQVFPRQPRPIELAQVGTCPLPVLKDLAEDESFNGTVLCGVTEVLTFMPLQAPPALEITKFINHYHHQSPASRWALYLSVPFESGLAFLNLEDLSLDALLKRWIPVENRPGTRVYPPLPPYFASTDWDRRQKMWSRIETDPALQHKVQQVWLPLIKMIPPVEGDLLTAIIGSIRDDVAKIQARGGRVVFIRCPSTGTFLEIERELRPRAAYWDRLLQETGAPGIHFEDYPELSGFDCPEWSHLSRSDAVLFTYHLAGIYRRMITRSAE